MNLRYEKYFISAVVFLILCVLGFLIFKQFLLNINATKDPKKISELPFKVASNKQKKIIIIFSSTCEDCQNKAQQIRKHIKDFEHRQILMVSPEDSTSIKKFAIQYQLNNLSNVRFLHLSKEKIFTTFSTTTVPYILVYNQSGDLDNSFKGDIKIEKLIEMVHK